MSAFQFYKNFRESPYCIDSCNEFVIATGDEGGVVRLFDIRKKNPVDELLIDDGRCEDTINDIYIDSNGKYLVAASADGTLCAYNCKSTGSKHFDYDFEPKFLTQNLLR